MTGNFNARIIDTLKLTCPVLVSATTLGIFVSLAEMYHSQNNTYNSISQMLDSSDQGMKALIPAASILAAAGLTATSSFVYETNCSLVENSTASYELKSASKKVFFINTALQRLSYVLFQCAIAVTLSENQKTHYGFSALFFTLFPMSNLIDLYILFRTDAYLGRKLNPGIRRFCRAVKFLGTGLSCIGLSQILYYIIGPNYSNSSLIIGEYLLLGSAFLHGVSLSSELYAGMYSLKYKA